VATFADEIVRTNEKALDMMCEREQSILKAGHIFGKARRPAAPIVGRIEMLLGIDAVARSSRCSPKPPGTSGKQ